MKTVETVKKNKGIYINPRLKSWVNEKNKCNNRFNGFYGAESTLLNKQILFVRQFQFLVY